VFAAPLCILVRRNFHGFNYFEKMFQSFGSYCLP